MPKAIVNSSKCMVVGDIIPYSLEDEGLPQDLDNARDGFRHLGETVVANDTSWIIQHQEKISYEANLDLSHLVRVCVQIQWP